MTQMVINDELTLNGEKGVRIRWRKVNGDVPVPLQAPDGASTLTVTDKNGDQILKRGYLDDVGLKEIVRQAAGGKIRESDILTVDEMIALLPSV